MQEENHKPGSDDGIVREPVPQHLREIADPTTESSRTRCPMEIYLRNHAQSTPSVITQSAITLDQPE